MIDVLFVLIDFSLFQPGAFECPCRVGMTCVTKTEEVGEGRCVYVTTEPDEVEEAHPRWIFN